MRKRYYSLFASIIMTALVLVFSINNLYSFQHNEINLVVKKIKGVWKVVDATDSTKTTIKAKKRQKITWTAEGTDVYFQFMDDKLVGKFKNALKDGKSISLNITPNAKIGENSYAVFCIADMQYAEGNSPPVIIVEND